MMTNWMNVHLKTSRLIPLPFSPFFLLSFCLMSLRLPGFHPCRVLICQCVLVMLIFFIFFYTHVASFFWAIRPICCTGSNPSLQRRGERLEETYPLHSPYTPLVRPMNAQPGGGECRGCLRVYMSESVHVCTHVRRTEPIKAAPGTPPPHPVFVWSAPSPPSVVSAAV